MPDSHDASTETKSKRKERPLGGIDPSRLYRGEEISRRLGMSQNTLTLWIARGLNAYGPGTNANLFLGREVIDFIIAAGPKDKSAMRRAHRDREQRRVAQTG